jgi:hypothetical protein
MPGFMPYSQLKTITSVNSVPLIGLSDDDDAVSYDRLNDTFSDGEVDAYGNMMHVEGADERGNVVIKTKQTAVSDISILQAAFDARTPITVVTVDRSTSGAVAMGLDGRIKRPPKFTRGKGGVVIEWNIICGHTKIVHAGQKIVP